MTAVYNLYDPDDLVILGLNAGQDPTGDLEVFVETFQIEFPLLVNTGLTYTAYRQQGAVSPFPLDYVIDPSGGVAYHSTEYEPERMVEVINGLLGFPAPAPEELPPLTGLRLAAAPNPFNPRTVLSFDLPAAGPVTLDIMDTRGRRVRRLLIGEWHAAGPARVSWDGLDQGGQAAAAGVYFVRLSSSSAVTALKIALVR